MENPVLITFLLCSYGKSEEQFKNSIESIVTSMNSNTEFLIVEQNSDQRVKKYLEQNNIPHTLYLHQEGKGLSRARNLGLKSAKGRWVLLCDDDATFGKESIQNLIATLKLSQEDQSYYGVAKVLDKPNLEYIRRGPKLNAIHLWNFDVACSIELVLNRKALLNIGGFDERFGAGSTYPAGEEADVVIRLKDHSHKITRIKSFEIFHPKWDTDDGRKAYYGQGLGTLYRKHIFKNPLHLIVFSFKVLLETAIRMMLSIQDKTHFDYLLGFYQGLLKGNTK